MSNADSFLIESLRKIGNNIEKILDRINAIENANAASDQWRYHRDKQLEDLESEVRNSKKRIAILESWRWFIFGGSAVISIIAIWAYNIIVLYKR